MIKTIDELLPRNKNIEDNDAHEEKVIAKQQVEGAKRAKRIDELADMGREDESEYRRQRRMLKICQTLSK